MLSVQATNLDQLVQHQRKSHQKNLLAIKLGLVKKWTKMGTFQKLTEELEQEVPLERAKKYKEIFFPVRQENLPSLKLRGDVFTLTNNGKNVVSLWIDPTSNSFKINDQTIEFKEGASFEDVLKQIEMMNLVVYQNSFLIDEAHAAILTALIVGGILLALGDLIASAISKSNCKANFMKFKQDNVTNLTTCQMEMGLIKSGQMSKAESDTYRLLLRVQENNDDPVSCLETVQSSFKSFSWFRYKSCVETEKATVACNGLEDLTECLKEFENYEPQVASETLFSMEHQDAPYVSNDPRLKDVFTAYGACYGLDWRVLKGIAKAESSLNPNVGCDSKYAGLFQISKKYCRSGRQKYSAFISEEDCEAKRCDVEVNTAVSSYHLDQNFKRIQRVCPESTLEEVILLSYVGHNNGPAVLSHVLAKKACKKDEQAAAVRSFYDERGGSFRGVDADWGERKWKYGQKIADSVKNLGATRIRVPINNELCPITYGGMGNVPDSHFLEGRRHAAPSLDLVPVTSGESSGNSGTQQ
jgi:hypothetical protein